jgi:ABC-type multidrug transport system permease subunit
VRPAARTWRGRAPSRWCVPALLLLFLLPGLIGLNLLGTGMWGIGFAIANWRQQRLLRRMIATPMRRSDFLLALMIARLL